MPSRVTVFTHNGLAFAEANTATTRSYMLNGVGRLQFPLASFTDPACRREVMQYGNFIVVDHIPTRDENGLTRGTLPVWAGLILPPQEWDFGILTVTAYSLEALLDFRPMPYVLAAGTAGAVYGQMLQYANNFGGYPINPGTIFESSPNTQQNLRLSMLGEAQALSRNFQQDFDVQPLVNSNNTLDLFANWYSQKGVVVNSVFSEGTNGNMKLPKLTEQGNLANVVFGYGAASSSGSRASDVEEITDSSSDYGRLGASQNFDVTTPAAIAGSTLSYAQLHARPYTTLELIALDVDKTFDYLIPGNIWNVTLESVGFSPTGGIGFTGPARLTGIEYDDWTNEARLTTQVLTAGLSQDGYP